MSAITNRTTETFAAAIAEPGLTVVAFWAPWCAPCHSMAPSLQRAATLRPDYHFAKVNIDEQPALASQFGVMSIPTLAVLRACAAPRR